MAEKRVRKIQESKLLRKSRDLKPLNNDSAGPPPKLFINTGTEQGNASQSPQGSGGASNDNSNQNSNT